MSRSSRNGAALWLSKPIANVEALRILAASPCPFLAMIRPATHAVERSSRPPSVVSTARGQLKLTREQLAFLDEQAHRKGFDSALDYLLDLLDLEMAKEALRQTLMEGASSGDPVDLDDAYIIDLQSYIEARSAGQADRCREPAGAGS